jgi:adenosyl cobinamide kinase/adenosyl cobinamide phosphate guanylyltransferase
VPLTLVIGGTRSGKSAHAERLAAAAGLPVRYVGTADPEDASMASRIATHQARRPADWETAQAGDDLADSVRADAVTLIDGLGVWIAGRERSRVEPAIARLITVARTAAVIVVAEQSGEGTLPMDRVSRDWLDLLGTSTQQLSAAAQHAQLVVAGRVLELPPV